MEQKIYYVAVAYDTIFSPTIVEKFENPEDATSYAALMSRTKQRKYVVLEQVQEWENGFDTAESNN